MSRQTVVVTGVGHGIGKATAERFAREEGVALVLGDLNEEWLAETAAVCEGLGADVLALPFDQRSSDSVDALFAGADDRFGRIDVLANVVGIYPGALVTTMSNELWDEVLLTNLTGLFYCCRAGMARMLAAGGGSIVNVASTSAAIPLKGMSAYAASKGGIEAFSRVLALEGAPTVRVNAVAPGPILTWPMSDADANSFDPVAAIPMGRWGQPEEIAESIAFLASPAATFMTGQVLRVNGGKHMA